MNASAIKKACEAVGGQAKLAELLDISPQAVNLWISKNRLPSRRVLEIERATGVNRHELRPDLYPNEGVA